MSKYIGSDYDEDLCDKTSKSLIESIRSELTVLPLPVKTEDVAVKEYLQHLVDIKFDIQFFIQQLRICISKKIINDRALVLERSKAPNMLKDELIESIAKCQRKKVEIEDKRRFDSEKYNLEDELGRRGLTIPAVPQLPIKPDISEPDEPIIEKAGLFNKKKIEKQNNELIEKYRADKEIYFSRMKEYEDSMSQYNHQMELYKNAKLSYEEKIKDVASKLEKKREEDEKRNASLKEKELESVEKDEKEYRRKLVNIKETIEQYISSSYPYLMDIIICEEMEEIKGHLKDLFDCEGKLLALNVINKKYLDLAALTTILDYYESERVTELKGPDGAYNLYEAELKTNIIIGKLDKVIESLDDIRNSQFLLYDKLNGIHRSIDKMTEKMEKGMDSITRELKAFHRDNNNQLEMIKKNTALTAYYSEKNAQYSKRIADLTATVGWLVALK